MICECNFCEVLSEIASIALHTFSAYCFPCTSLPSLLHNVKLTSLTLSPIFTSSLLSYLSSISIDNYITHLELIIRVLKIMSNLHDNTVEKNVGWSKRVNLFVPWSTGSATETNGKEKERESACKIISWFFLPHTRPSPTRRTVVFSSPLV